MFRRRGQRGGLVRPPRPFDWQALFYRIEIQRRGAEDGRLRQIGNRDLQPVQRAAIGKRLQSLPHGFFKIGKGPADRTAEHDDLRVALKLAAAAATIKRRLAMFTLVVLST